MKIVIVGAGISGLASYISLTKHLPRLSAPAEDHEYTIYEAYDTNKDTTFEQRLSASESQRNPSYSSSLIVGGGLAVGPNGVNVLRRLDSDMLKDIVRGGYVISKYNLKSKHGTVLMSLNPQVPDDIDSDSLSGHEGAANGSDGGGSGGGGGAGSKEHAMIHTVATSRHSLWQCLRARVPDKVIIQRRVSEVIAGSNGSPAVIRFEDGSTPVEADLVIGADGLRSITKRALFPDIKGDAYPPQYE